MNFEIKLAKLQDCKELSKVKKSVWETTYRGIYKDEKINNYDFFENKKKFERIIMNNEVDLYIVIKDDNIIGYMSVGSPIIPFKEYKQEIGLLYILKDYQKIGIGRRLFEIAYNNIKEKGYKEFFISCNKYNYPAQEFYKKMGGKIVHIDNDCEDKSIPQVKFHYNIM